VCITYWLPVSFFYETDMYTFIRNQVLESKPLKSEFGCERIGGKYLYLLVIGCMGTVVTI